MKAKTILLTLCLLILFNTNALAGDIDQGTISVGASSDLLFTHSDSSFGGKANALIFSPEMGYFFLKNWEIGAQLRIGFYDYEDGDSQDYDFWPFIGYHWVLNEKSNLYARVGGGWGFYKNNNDYGYESDGKRASLFGEVGYEFFLTENVAIDFSILGERYWSENNYKYDDDWPDDEDSSTRNNITSRLKFKLYF